MTKSKKVCVKTICRICLAEGTDMHSLYEMSSDGTLAELLTSCTNVKLRVDNRYPQHICEKCTISLKNCFNFKTLAESSDKKLTLEIEKPTVCKVNKIKFDNIQNIKSQLAIKEERKYEIEVLPVDFFEVVTTDESDVINLYNTTIKKASTQSCKSEFQIKDEAPDIKWEKVNNDFDNDTSFPIDNDSDEDYVPLKEIAKTKFKKPKLDEIKVLRLKTTKQPNATIKAKKGNGRTTAIQCYPVLKNGEKGKPVMLKRPRDATLIKYSPGIPITLSMDVDSNTKSSKTIRRVKIDNMKNREKTICPVCGILTGNMEMHMNTHTEKKKYKCNHCHQQFNQRGNLATHMKKHTGHRDQVCEVCGAAFYTRKTLLRHNMIHMGKREFQCDMCTKSFFVNCDLNRHKRIHAGYKPYKCGNCAMSFNAKHQLQAHERMHTGERPYSCRVCNTSFAYKVNLNNHCMKIHGINLKFKSIHVVTREVLQQEAEMAAQPRAKLPASTDENEMNTLTCVAAAVKHLRESMGSSCEDVKDFIEISVTEEMIQR